MTTNIMKSLIVLAALLMSHAASAVTYVYDDLNRLTSATFDSGPPQIYTYDPAGNLLTMSTTGVTKINQTVSFGTAPTLSASGTGTVSATATSALTVIFSSITPTVCTVIGSAVAGVAAGTCTIAADQAGDANYNIAPQVTQSFTVAAAVSSPGAPTVISATAGNTQAVVSFTAPASDGGSPITIYTATCGGVSATGTNSPITVTGLTSGMAYTCSVTAANSAGTSPASAASNSVTPSASVTSNTVSTSAGANGSISPASQTVASGNSTSFTVTPATGYTAFASGCGGSLNGGTYTTGAITGNCTVSATFAHQLDFAAGWNLSGNGSDTPLNVASTFSDATKVTTVWKWLPTTSQWAFYTPSMAGQQLTDYIAAKGYVALGTINAGEGFWVNAKTAFAATISSGNAVTAIQFGPTLPKGWSLISLGAAPQTPTAFNTALGYDITTLWAWDNPLSKWYFYAPSLERNGSLQSYIQSKGYFDFTQQGKTLGWGMGFWVNKP